LVCHEKTAAVAKEFENRIISNKRLARISGSCLETIDGSFSTCEEPVGVDVSTHLIHSVRNRRWSQITVHTDAASSLHIDRSTYHRSGHRCTVELPGQQRTFSIQQERPRHVREIEKELFLVRQRRRSVPGR